MATEAPRLRLDVLAELVELLRSGRARIIGRRPYVVNGREMVQIHLFVDEVTPSEDEETEG